MSMVGDTFCDDNNPWDIVATRQGHRPSDVPLIDLANKRMGHDVEEERAVGTGDLFAYADHRIVA